MIVGRGENSQSIVLFVRFIENSNTLKFNFLDSLIKGELKPNNQHKSSKYKLFEGPHKRGTYNTKRLKLSL
ncbi:hypothetical protein ACK4EN_10405 [Enterococcus hirae]